MKPIDIHTHFDTIIHGDCAITMKTLPDDCIDLTVTSPPYDNLRDYNGYTFDFETIAQQLFRITKKGGVVVWVVGDATIKGSETGTSFKQALYFKEIGFNLHDTMIWRKAGFTSICSSLCRYPSEFEYMFILSKEKNNTFNPIRDRMSISTKRGGGCVRQKDGSLKRKKGGQPISKKIIRGNIWRIPAATNSHDVSVSHPARFPEKLASDHIISWSNPGDLVFDPFMGSGTTAAMAIKNGRHYLGCEISQEYINIAEKRIKLVTLPLF